MTITVSGEKITYFHNDLVGSPLAATDATGKVIWKENYQPFGGQRKKDPASATNRQFFAGKPLDVDTGLAYFGARYYDPVVGRFMGIDRAPFSERNLNSFNAYAYGNNNPYRFVDPDGDSPLDIGFLVVDVIKLGVAIYRGEGIGAAAVEAGISVIGVVVPLPGAGVALKAARAEKTIETTAEAAATVKKVPNPFGKAGGPAHQAKVQEVAAEVEARGLTAAFEHKGYVDFDVSTEGVCHRLCGYSQMELACRT